MQYNYSVVRYRNGTGETMMKTDSLTQARLEVVRLTNEHNEAFFILRDQKDVG